MVNSTGSRTDRIFQALSDATRRAMLLQLAKGEATVGELARPHTQSLAAISKHLKVLEQAELIRKSKMGRVITCKANFEALGDAFAVLEELGAFWRGKLDALEALFLNEPSNKENTNANRSGAVRPPKGRR